MRQKPRAQNAQRSFLMKTKRFFLFGLPVLLLAVSASLVLAGCGGDDEEDDPKGAVATISLAATGNNTFTLTLDGVTWNDTITDLRDGDSLAIIAALTWSPGSRPNVAVARTSDTVLTVTLTDVPNAGSITLKSDDWWSEDTGAGTHGATYLSWRTNEGKTFDKKGILNGTLTVASGSATTVSVTATPKE
jgi:hypothetical protein